MALGFLYFLNLSYQIFCGYTARIVSDLDPTKTGFVMSQVHYNRGFKISRIQFLMPVAWGIEVISGFASFAHGFRISRYTAIGNLEAVYIA